jgi:hypothetical protein
MVVLDVVALHFVESQNELIVMDVEAEDVSVIRPLDFEGVLKQRQSGARNLKHGGKSPGVALKVFGREWHHRLRDEGEQTVKRRLSQIKYV